MIGIVDKNLFTGINIFTALMKTNKELSNLPLDIYKLLASSHFLSPIADIYCVIYIAHIVITTLNRIRTIVHPPIIL